MGISSFLPITRKGLSICHQTLVTGLYIKVISQSFLVFEINIGINIEKAPGLLAAMAQLFIILHIYVLMMCNKSTVT